MSRAFDEAKHIAQMLRRCGYPEATAAREYCVDAEIGTDNFYTYTVSVYAGEYRPETIPPLYRSLMQKLGLRA